MQVKLSEIRARQADPLSADVVHLLDLVKRLGKMLDGLVFRYHGDHSGDWEDCHFHKCKEARALLKELEL